MYRFPGKNFLFSFMFGSLAVPYIVVLLPLFVILTQVGLTEPFFAMIVPWIAPAFGQGAPRVAGFGQELKD